LKTVKIRWKLKRFVENCKKSHKKVVEIFLKMVEKTLYLAFQADRECWSSRRSSPIEWWQCSEQTEPEKTQKRYHFFFFSQ
jgi:hypothetical protein